MTFTLKPNQILMCTNNTNNDIWIPNGPWAIELVKPGSSFKYYSGDNEKTITGLPPEMTYMIYYQYKWVVINPQETIAIERTEAEKEGWDYKDYQPVFVEGAHVYTQFVSNGEPLSIDWTQ